MLPKVLWNGYYNIERMMKYSINKGAEARGLKNIQLFEGAEISRMAEFSEWVVVSDKVITLKSERKRHRLSLTIQPL